MEPGSSKDDETKKDKKQQMQDRMKKLRELHNARNEARTHNHKEVVAEDARIKLPTNWETRKRQAEWILSDDKKREEATQRGVDYDRTKLLNVSAIDAEKIDRKKKSKKNPDIGFSDYEAQTARQYNRLVKNLPPRDMVKYEAQKEKLGDAFYGGPNTILHGLHKDTPNAIDNMVKDLDQQISKRKKFSRRRTHNDDDGNLLILFAFWFCIKPSGITRYSFPLSDIDYINEKNARFNKKLERFYGEHTTEIKQNLERGTAI